jgi:hypothetical protein
MPILLDRVTQQVIAQVLCADLRADLLGIERRIPTQPHTRGFGRYRPASRQPIALRWTWTAGSWIRFPQKDAAIGHEAPIQPASVASVPLPIRIREAGDYKRQRQAQQGRHLPLCGPVQVTGRLKRLQREW